MGLSSYKKGAHFENRVKKFLEGFGYLVIRTPSSKGPFDLVAIRNGCVLLIQCKVKKQYMSKKAWRSLDDSVKITGAMPLLAYRVPPRWRIVFEHETGNEHVIQ